MYIIYIDSKQGDATIHNGRTLHYAFGNKTKFPRSGYIGIQCVFKC